MLMFGFRPMPLEFQSPEKMQSTSGDDGRDATMTPERQS
jgi:hypothetical protein